MRLKESEIVHRQRYFLAKHPSGSVVKLMCAKNVDNGVITFNDLGEPQIQASRAKKGWALVGECDRHGKGLGSQGADIDAEAARLREVAEAEARASITEERAEEALRQQRIDEAVEAEVQKRLAEMKNKPAPKPKPTPKPKLKDPEG